MNQPDPLRVDFHLLDRQIVDVAGAKVGKVDDVEFDTGPDGRITVAALLVGQEVLGRRIGGRLGRWMAGMARRLRSDSDPSPLRIPFEHVTEVGSEITLGLRADVLETAPLETWLRERLIERIPGARDAHK